MLRIVTDVELCGSSSTPKSGRGARLLRRVSGPVLAVVTVCSCTVLPLARPVAGDQIANDKAKAAAIQAEIQQTSQRISALGQEFDAAELKVQNLDQQISATQSQIAQDRQRVARDQQVLRQSAIDNYVTDGSATAQNPLFSSNQSQQSDVQEYTQVAEGDVDTAVANLHTAQSQLGLQESQLQGQQQQATSAADSARAAQQSAQALESQQNQALSQANAQVQSDIAAAQAAAAAAAQRAAEQRIAAAQAQAAAQAAAARTASTGGGARGGGPGGTFIPPPPPAAGGAGGAAVAAAESQIGVPYVWGGESPRGTPGDPSGGFDCSGLVAWAWGQAGVSLPHYSGAQMADSTPVPISDLQPGDLLFYGPGGSEHVAMYIGGGEMIEAPYTGASVWITGVRLGSGFAGAGRP